MNILHAEQDLLEIKRVFDSLNMPFWLNGGTLLASIRDKQLLPWDHDIDILIRAEDYSEDLLTRFIPYFTKITPIKHMLNRVTCFDLQKYSDVRTNVILLHKNEERGVYVKLNPPLVNNCKTLIPIEMIDNDNYIDFLGTKFRIPYKAEELLTSHYGDWSKKEVARGREIPWRRHWETIKISDYSNGII